MGRRGPPKTPTAELKRRGSWRGKTKDRQNEVKPEGRALRPAWLSEEAREEWDRIAPELERLELLTAVDVISLAAYCECYAQWREALRQIEKNGPTIVISGENGSWEQQSPWFLVLHKSLEKMRSIGARFGFTPSDRVGLPKPEAKKSDGEEVAKILGFKVTG